MTDLDKMSNQLMSDDEYEKRMDNAMAFVTLCAIVGLAVWSGASMMGVIVVVVGFLLLLLAVHALVDIAAYFRGVAK